MWYKKARTPKLWRKYSQNHQQIKSTQIERMSVKGYDAYTKPISNVIEHFNALANDYLYYDTFNIDLLNNFFTIAKKLLTSSDTRTQSLLNEIVLYCRNMSDDIREQDTTSAYTAMWTISNLLKMVDFETKRYVTDLESPDVFFGEPEDPNPTTGSREQAYDYEF